MLKLSRHLFQWKPSAEIADFYERALFNHILASQHPVDGRVIYNLSLEMGGYKVYENPESFTCCVGTGMETHSKYGRNIFFKNDEDLYISQFVAATVDWKDRGIRITQKTNFPEEQGTTISIDKANRQEFNLHIRYPYWAEKGIEIFINGNKKDIDQQQGSFVELSREWNSGDIIDVMLPFTLRLEPIPDDMNRVALCYGPLVMAGDLGPVDDPAADNHDYVPVFFTEDRNPENWLNATGETANTFEVSESVARPRTFHLKPFYATHERRYSVYWDMYSEKSWALYQSMLREEIERKKIIDENTLDLFLPGDPKEEKDHALIGDKIRVMNFRHKKARVADRGGWFSFELNVDESAEMALLIHYWGGFTGSKTFDILVNGEKIATENISGKKDGEFVDILYGIDSEIFGHNNKILVKFVPHEGHRAGPIFGARTIYKRVELK
jgi:hypothetical protein